jgi:hypothetical protein
MKIDTMMRFPHPVLWSETTDYAEGEVSAEIEIAENPTTGKVALKCGATLTEGGIRSRCDSGQAMFGLSVVCLETYFNRLFNLPLSGGDIGIEPGLLRGQVLIRPIIWANDAIEGYSSKNIHDEFGKAPLNFEKSTVLAIGDETVIDVGAEKLAPIGSVFALALENGIPDGQVAIQTEEAKIEILASSSTLEWIAQMRNTVSGKAILLSSVYLPVVMAVLDTMRSKDPVHEDKRWFRVFRAKLTQLGLSVESPDLLEVAQALLKSPLGKLNSLVDLKI